MEDIEFKTGQKQFILVIILIMGFIPMLLFSYLAYSSLIIYYNADKYKKGVFYMDTFECSTLDDSDATCWGYGTINGGKADVLLGKTPGTNSIYDTVDYADYSSDTIPVFYLPSLNRTIIIKQNEEKIDKNKYLKKGIINLIYPLIIYPFLIFLYKRTTKQLKQIRK